MQPDSRPWPKHAQSEFTSDVLGKAHQAPFIGALSWGVVVQYAHHIWPVPGVAATILVGRAFICAVGLRSNIGVATKYGDVFAPLRPWNALAGPDLRVHVGFCA